MSENFTADPPNKEGATQCIARWTMETPAGWLGAYNKEAFEAYAEHVRKPLLDEIERLKLSEEDHCQQLRKEQLTVQELRATIERQREVITKYGRHQQDCPARTGDSACDCGFDAAPKAELEKP